MSPKSFAIPVLFLMLVGIYSCSSPEKKAEEYDQKSEEVYSEKAENLFSQMVGVGELPYALMSVGADFDPNIPNQAGRSSSYQNSPEQAALNLGIYLVDISYAVAYDEFDLAGSYYDDGNALAEYLGEGRIFNQAILQDYGDKIENDTALMQLNEAVLNARMNFKEDNRIRIGTLILSGMFIERLYLSTQILTNYPGEDLPEEVKQNILAPVMTAVYNQREPLDRLMEYIDEVIKPEDKKIIYNELKELQNDYKDLGSIWETGDADALALMTDKDYMEVAQRVQKIRGLIVNMES